MKFILYIILVFYFCSCGQTTNNDKIEFYNNNQDQFTFLVFDRLKVDTFMSRYKPLQFSNKLIKKDLITLAKVNFENDTTIKLPSFLKNSENPDTSDFKLAINVINATYNQNGEEYFDGSLNYLFFNNCLPEAFKNKWSQTISGDFKFNSTFFAILRDKSEIIDKMIYGDIGHWDKELKQIFTEHIFNEITPDRAKKIKKIILTDKSFADIRFKVDKDNFLYFLDKTINNEWRLILTDWN